MAESAERERDDEELGRLSEALLAGRKIEAIKIYRDRTGCGLKEAKDEVEALEANLRSRHPEKFAVARKASGGCAGILLAAISTAVITLLACAAAATGLGFR